MSSLMLTLASAAADTVPTFDPRLLFATLGALAVLLGLILIFHVQAFLALLLASISLGLFSGMPLSDIAANLDAGMGKTLASIAGVIGLGSVFGKILEDSGGAESMARALLRAFGLERAPWALMFAGFLISIPVFFDVAVVLLMPLLYVLHRDTKKSLIFFAFPLIIGLAVTHTFVPPTPGPVAAAKFLSADIGLVILWGIVLGLPCAIIGGPILGVWMSKRIQVGIPPYIKWDDTAREAGSLPSFWLVFGLIGLPLLLMLGGSVVDLSVKKELLAASRWTDLAGFLGRPLVALLIATFGAWYLLGIRRGFSLEKLQEIAGAALEPAGLIILVTGAGGVFKEMLVASGAGTALAGALQSWPVSPILLAWVLAAVVRALQGSATVAMLTAAGFMAPVTQQLGLSDHLLAICVISISSGATVLSHVNDSGFWMISRYLGMSEKQMLRSWTLLETAVGVSGLVFCLLAATLVG
jgi:Gnt-I system low-affinity gluconate transporter